MQASFWNIIFGEGVWGQPHLCYLEISLLPLCPGVDLGWYLLYPSVPTDFPRFSFRIQSLSYQHCCVRAVFVRCQCGLSLNLWNYNVKLPISLIQHFLCITYSVHCAALMFPPHKQLKQIIFQIKNYHTKRQHIATLFMSDFEWENSYLLTFLSIRCNNM